MTLERLIEVNLERIKETMTWRKEMAKNNPEEAIYWMNQYYAFSGQRILLESILRDGRRKV